MTDYRSSTAYKRSQGTRPDGRPVWPLTVEDIPSLAHAHARVAAREEAKRLNRRVTAAGGFA